MCNLRRNEDIPKIFIILLHRAKYQRKNDLTDNTFFDCSFQNSSFLNYLIRNLVYDNI